MAGRIRRRGFLEDPVRVLGLVVLAANVLFFGLTVGIVVFTLRRWELLTLEFERVQGAYVAEDLFYRALGEKDGLPKKGTIFLPEGGLSSDPLKKARVDLVWLPEGPELRATLGRRGQTLLYRGSFLFGRLPEAFSLTLGEMEPGTRENLRCEGPRRKLEKEGPWKFPFLEGKTWDVPEDLRIAVGEGSPPLFQRRKRERRNFRQCEELGPRYLGRPTDLDDFELVSANPSTKVVVLGSGESGDLVIRVQGNLWIGRPESTLKVTTGGRSVVVFATGNIYLLGALRLLGKEDSLFLLAGSREGASFRDLDRDGVRDPGEPLLGEVRKAWASPWPSEGTGSLYIGIAGGRPRIESFLVSKFDVVVGPEGAEVQGGILTGGRILAAPKGGRLRISPGAADRNPRKPRAGLPLDSRSRGRVRVFDVQLLEAALRS